MTAPALALLALVSGVPAGWSVSDSPREVVLEHRLAAGQPPTLRLACRPDSASAVISLRADPREKDLLAGLPWSPRLRLEGGGKTGRIKGWRTRDAAGAEWITGRTWVLRVQLRSFRRTGLLVVASGPTRRGYRAAPADMATIERFFDRCD